TRTQELHRTLVTQDETVVTRREVDRLVPVRRQRGENRGQRMEHDLVDVPLVDVVALPEVVATRAECANGNAVTHEHRALVEVEVDVLEHDRLLSGGKKEGGRRRGSPARRGEIGLDRVAVTRGLRSHDAAAVAFAAAHMRARPRREASEERAWRV